MPLDTVVRFILHHTLPKILIFGVVEIVSRSAILAADGIALITIWIKTYMLAKQSRRVGLQTHLGEALLRDGASRPFLLIDVDLE